MLEPVSTNSANPATLPATTASAANSDSPSQLDDSRYEAQKALYDFHLSDPEDVHSAFVYIVNHIKALKEYGDYDNSRIVIVSHGNEIHALARLNQAAYPDIYPKLQELNESGVHVRVCSNAARSRGYKIDDFYNLITVVPAAVIDIAKWQGQGYSYMLAGVQKKLTREDLLVRHPALQDS